MNSNQLWTVLTSAVYAILFFGVVMGISMYAVTFNADWSPAVIWFPVPVLALLGVATFWAQRQWSIGLTVPANVPLGPVYGFGIAVTILGVSVCILQGAYHGLVRHVEVVSTDVTPVFAFTYHFLMSIVAALLAEVTFRGIMQTRLLAVMGVWPVVIIVAVVNTLAHRWDIELASQWLGFFVTLGGWGYLRWLSRSLWPPLILHGVNNLLLAAALWRWGPLDHAELGAVSLSLIAAAGTLALFIAIFIARGMTRPGRATETPVQA